MGAVCTRICGCQCLKPLSHKPGDSEDDTRRRHVGSAVLIWMGIAALPSTFIILADGKSARSWVVGTFSVVCTPFIGVPLLLFSSVSPHRTMAGVLLVFAFAALAIDLGNSTEGSVRLWSAVVIVLDVCLVFNMKQWLQNSVVLGAMIYLAAEELDHVVNYGLRDAGNLGHGPPPYMPCDCASPPCARAVDNALQAIIVYYVIFMTDFALTRGFSNGLRHQMALVASSVEVAEQVSAALARFDLEAAGGALAASGDRLPQDLASSLHRLLGNLASYRPYLPQSCFETSSDGGNSESPSDSSAHDSPAVVSVLPVLDKANSFTTVSASGDGGCPAETGKPPSPRSPTHRHVRPRGSSVARSSRRKTEGARSDSSSSDAARISPRSSTTSSKHKVVTLADRTHQPQQRRVTLLARNSGGLLAARAQADVAEVADWLASEVERFNSTIQSLGGMTDLMSGDHLSASFGAVKVLGTQRERAARAAVLVSDPAATHAVGQLGELHTTVAVSAGSALCGDFGSDAARRFMIIGGVSSFIVAMERAAAAWRAGTLLDAVVHQDTTSSWHCRLRKRVTFPKLSPKPIGLWEVTQPAEGAQHNDEWMYEMESAQKNPWEAYNNAVMSWCEEKREAALAVVEAALLLQDGAVAEALHALRKQVQEGTAAPEGPLTAGALAGDPSPLSLPE